MTGHKRQRNVTMFLMAVLFPMMFLITSFVVKERNMAAIMNNEGNFIQTSAGDTIKAKSETEKVRVPFILRLSQNGKENVTPILDSTNSAHMRSGFVTLQPNENVGSHNTGDREEILIILHGKGRLDIDGIGKKDIEEGMAVYIPPKNQHNVYCTGSTPLQYVYVVSPVK
jgi:mannose-6-phosphate isomerase-like protein (cupin superfamily)